MVNILAQGNNRDFDEVSIHAHNQPTTSPI